MKSLGVDLWTLCCVILGLATQLTLQQDAIRSAVEMTANNVLSLSQNQMQQYPPAYGGLRSPQAATDIWTDDYHRSSLGFKMHTIQTPVSARASRQLGGTTTTSTTTTNKPLQSPPSIQTQAKPRSKSVDHRPPSSRYASSDSISDYLAGELFAGDKREGEAARVSEAS